MAQLPEVICLDTVTLMSWIRVDLAQQVIGGRISDGCEFFVESVVVDEAKRRLGALGAALVDAVLGLGVEVVQLESASREDWMLAASLARRMTDAQVAAGKLTNPSRSANLGEAASIVFIQTQRPGSMFVTSDREAEKIGTQAGVLVARTSAFFAIEVELQKLTYEDLWAAVCDTRECSEDVAK